MENVEHNIFGELVNNIFGEGYELPLSDESKKLIVSKARIIKLNKGEYLQIEGDVSKIWGYVIKGLVRIYYMRHEEEFTEKLAIDGDDFMDFESFYDQKPSIRYIQMLEPTTLVIFQRNDFQEIMKERYDIGNFFRLTTELMLLRLKKRSDESIFNTAKERYEHLMAAKPNLVLRTPSNIIASYLGITPETLSRIKSKN